MKKIFSYRFLLMIRNYLHFIILFLVIHSAFGQLCKPSGVESIVNGGFENGAAPSTFGVHTLFVPNGSPPTNYSSPGNYYIGYSSKVFNYGFPASTVYPHSGTKMLMIDAAAIVNAVCWQQTIKVKPGQTYFFSAWLTSLDNLERCQLQFQVEGNNETFFAALGPSQTAPVAGVWEQVYGTWNSGADTTAIIRLSDYNPSGYGASGNDFAVDDISFFNGCGKLVKGPKANFGADSLSLCWGGGSLDLNTNVTADAINIFTWFKDSVQLSNTTNALSNVTQTGTYTVCIDSATCLNETQVKVTANFFVDLGPNLNLCSPPTTILNTGITFPSNFQIDWKRDGVLIPGETGTNLTVTQAGTYKVEVMDKTGGLCHGTDSVTITSSLPVPHDVTFCPPTTTTALLSVTGNGHYVWWDAATGGNKVGSGTSYLATGLANTETFYVQDTTYTYYKAGLLNNTGLTGGGANNMIAQNFESFNATQNCILDTIAADILFNAATGPFQIQTDLVDVTANSTIDKYYTAGNQSAGEHYVDVPISLPLIAGHTYQIAIIISNAIGGTMRYGGFNAANYPLISPVLTLTAGQATSVYAGLFNWRLHMLSTCGRMPVNAIKSCPVACVIPQNPLLSPAGPYDYCQGTNISKLLTASVSNSGAATFYYEFFRNGISVQSPSSLNTDTATQEGGYYVIISDSANPTVCNAQTTKVIINSFVNPAVSAGGGTVCSGSSVTVTAGGANTYSWSNGLNNGASNTVDPTLTTTYTVTGTDANNCTNTAQAVVTIILMPTVTAGGGLLCIGGSTTVTAGGANTYLWSNGLNSTASNTVNPTITTTYTVTGTLSLNCSNTAQAVVTVILQPDITAGGGTVCIGGSTTITADGANTYLWSNGLNSTASNTVNPTITTTYTVTGTVSLNCANTAQSVVTVNPLPTPGITATKNLICSGDSSTIKASGGTSYYWQSGSTVDTISVAPVTTQNYSVTVANIYGCKVDTSLTIDVSVMPTPQILGSSIICMGASSILSVNGNDNYLWNTTQTVNVITVSPTIQTTYRVTAANSNGCTGTDQLIVFVNPLPIANAGKNDSVCNGQTYVLTASATGSLSYSYLWSVNNSTGSLLTINPVSSNTYSVTVKDNNGCTETSNVIIKVNPIPTPDITASKSTICPGENTTMKATGGISYQWQTGSTTDTITVVPIAKQTYSVVVANVYGCERDTSITIDISSVPSPQIIGSAVICDGAGEVLSVNGSDSYIWSTNQTNSSITVFPKIQTTYQLTATNSSGCTGTDQLMVSISPLPTADFIAQPLTGCQPLTVSFTDKTNSSVHIKSYFWDFGDASSGGLDNATVQSPSHLYNVDGSYTVNLDVTTDDDCQNSITQDNIIIVKPRPQASFSFTPSMPTTFNPNVQFLDNSINANSWTWNFGDINSPDNSSTDQNPNHAFSTYGDFPVQLIVVAGNGCEDSTVLTVHVNTEFTFYAPDAFTPNNDGLNDYFIPVGVGFNKENFQMYIFSRWGEEIFKTSSYQAWDGKTKGGSQVCPEGIYTWLVIFQDDAGKEHRYTGIVTLVQ